MSTLVHTALDGAGKSIVVEVPSRCSLASRWHATIASSAFGTPIGAVLSVKKKGCCADENDLHRQAKKVPLPDMEHEKENAW